MTSKGLTNKGCYSYNNHFKYMSLFYSILFTMYLYHFIYCCVVTMYQVTEINAWSIVYCLLSTEINALSIIDENLTFESHIKNIYKNVCQKLGAIRKTRICMDNRTSLTLYKSLVLPIIDYCDVVYMTANKANLQKLQIVQNIARRIILKADKRKSIDTMHKTLNILRLEDRTDYHMSNLSHKNIYITSETALSKVFEKVDMGNWRATRHVNVMNMVVPRVDSVVGWKAIVFRGPCHWNNLDTDLKHTDKLMSFEALLLKRACVEVDNHPT